MSHTETTPRAITLMVVAGEVSGDMHAAAVIRALGRRRRKLDVSGIGGDALASAGADLRYHVRDMAVMGVSEVLRRYGFFRRVFRETLAEAERRRPDAVLLVDYPGFNLRLARRLHAKGIRVIYYVCPQVWAWHRERIPRMAMDIDRLITIFPFEADCFEGTGLRVDFAGHPLVDETRAALAEPPGELPWGTNGNATRVALLPGSRTHEIRRILPVMWNAAVRLAQRRPESTFITAAPTVAQADVVRELLAKQTAAGPERHHIVVGRTREVLRQARGAMVASGTATIETALMGCPMVIAYRVAPLTYQVLSRLIHIPHIGMVNIVAGRELCREYVQRQATPRALADGLSPLLEDGPERDAMLAGLADVRAKLGDGNAAERAADVVLAELSRAR